MRTVLEDPDYSPVENYLVGLLWNEGYFFFKTVRKETTNLSNWCPVAATQTASARNLAVDGTTGWVTPIDQQSRNYLEPQKEGVIYQFFFGVSPSTARVFYSFPLRTDRGSITTDREVPSSTADVGYFDGFDSPYENPSSETEMWSVKDKVPFFNLNNPGINAKPQTINLNFYLNMYSYYPITNTQTARDIIEGKRKAHIYTMGDPEDPASAPSWLLRRFKQYMLKPEEVEVQI
jgi:hypothetical protein